MSLTGVLTWSSSGPCLSSGSTAYLLLHCQYSCVLAGFLMKVELRRAGSCDRFALVCAVLLFHEHPTLHLPNTGYIWIMMDSIKDFTVLVGCIFQLPVQLRLSSSFLLAYSHWILIKYVILTKQNIWPRIDNLIKSDSECNSIFKTLFRIILLSVIFHVSVTLVSRTVQ